MDTLFSRGWCATLSAMSQKIPLPLTVACITYLYWEESSVNHSDVANLKAL